jgi:hypothetical protein
MTRYGFNIRTHTGQRVDNISIMAATRDDAERRLRQMYQRCVVVECHTQAVGRQTEPLDIESVIQMVSASDPPRALAPSVDKSGTY